MHNPASSVGNETQNLLREFVIQTDHLISARQPDFIIIKKNKNKKKKNEKAKNKKKKKKKKKEKENLQNCGLCFPGDHRVKF